MLSLVGIIVGLALLIFLAFRGKSLLWAAPVCALLVAFTGGLDMFTAYTQNYMEGMVGFVKEWFPAFMLGAIFGQIMQDSGGAVSLTKAVVKLVGRDKAIFASVLCGGVLAYGGISGFVIIFSMYPIVLGLFKEADITRRLIPATIMTGAFTFAMSAMPGTPTIQNLIPTEYFGTTATAAPVIGIVCTIIMFVGPVLWLSWRAKKFRAAGEGYDEPDEMPEEVPDDKLPPAWCCFIPFVVIVILLNVFKMNIVVCLLAGILLVVLVLWGLSFNQLMLSAVHPALADSRGVKVFWQETVFSVAIAVVVTVSMTWVGLLVINSLLVLPAAAARNVSRTMFQYHLVSLLGAVLAGIAGLMTSYYVGSSAGAAITLYLAVWFLGTFLARKKQ